MPVYNPKSISTLPTSTASLLSVSTLPATAVLNQVAFLHGQVPSTDDGLYRWDGAAWDQTANTDTGTTGWITDEFVDFAGTAVTLSNTPSDAVEKMLVFRNGLLEENTGYSLVGLVLTFTLPASGTEDVVVFYQQ